jgi:hypothetical protein
VADLKVSFPEPCGEAWEGMTPSGCNRHCAACDKVIYDLAAMTFQDAEALLGQPDPPYVRARIAPDGTISLARDSGANRNGRRLVAAVSASMTLATAACQTPLGAVSPRFEISGETYSWYSSQQTRLVAADGRVRRPSLSKDARFRFSNLTPGTYTVSYTDMCGETHVGAPVTVTDEDVDVGMFRWEEECVIVGVMVRADEASRG